MENALEAGSEQVLVIARQEADRTIFAVIDDGSAPFDTTRPPAAFRSTKADHLGLGLALTERDVRHMSGELQFLATPTGEKFARISLPTDPGSPR